MLLRTEKWGTKRFKFPAGREGKEEEEGVVGRAKESLMGQSGILAQSYSSSGIIFAMNL